MKTSQSVLQEENDVSEMDNSSLRVTYEHYYGYVNIQEAAQDRRDIPIGSQS